MKNHNKFVRKALLIILGLLLPRNSSVLSEMMQLDKLIEDSS